MAASRNGFRVRIGRAGANRMPDPRRYADCCGWAKWSHLQVVMGCHTEKKLPPQGKGRIYGGRGQGAPCAWCGCTIDTSQIEYEVEWLGPEGLQRSQFHLACYERLRSRHED